MYSLYLMIKVSIFLYSCLYFVVIFPFYWSSVWITKDLRFYYVWEVSLSICVLWLKNLRGTSMLISRYSGIVNLMWFFLSQMLEIKAMVADMLDLPFADETFDVVIEKGTTVRIKDLDFAFPLQVQTLISSLWLLIYQVWIHLWFKDVLFVDSGDPWKPKAETVKKVKAMLQGIHRVLKPDGVFISISFGQVMQTKIVSSMN